MSHLHPAISRISNSISKPDTDSREYRGIELNNGLKAILISDPHADKAAASLNVNVGHLCDPKEIPGLAHFCEHMLFLGTKKYPAENTYSDFITTHGGCTNAYTGMEDTNFHFDVAPAQLREALDIFAQFFLDPMFTESATERELNAVDQENSRNIQNDRWRLYQLEHSLSKPNHDYHKFGTGNKKSLEEIPKAKGINVRSELLKFYNKYYSANLMGLAVLSNESLDDMTKYVCELFGNIVNKSVQQPSWPEQPYGAEQLRKRVYAVPIKDIRKLTLLWPCPDVHVWWESMPDHYIGHLLGHEGPGSLLSALKNRGWVNSVCAGSKTGATGFSFITVDVDLTEDGLDHVDDIIAVVYQYINMVKREGPQEWIFKEGKDLNFMNFKFKDNEKPISLTTFLASSLRHYPVEEVASGSCLWKYYKPELINQLLDLLVPENMMTIAVSQSFADRANLKEEWYAVEYSVAPHESEQEKRWKDPEVNDELKLPSFNSFIPHNFDLCDRDPHHSAYPRIVKDTLLSRCWFKQDDEFNLPKACMSVAIRSTIASSSPINANLTWLYLRLFNDKFAEYSYDAELTKLRYDLGTAHYGLNLNISGYTDKLSVLLEKIMSTLTSFTPDEKRVAVFRELYERGLRNFKMAQPTQHADYRLGLLLKEGVWTIEEMLDCVDEMTVENLSNFIPQLFSRVHLEILIYGNLTINSALTLVDTVESMLERNMNSKPLPFSQRSRIRREVMLPDDSSYVFYGQNDIQPASCILNYYQISTEDTESIMLLEVLVKIIKDPIFNTLRTKEQLGYVVYASMRRASGVQGLQVVVQSSKHPEYVDSRIEAFIESIEDLLENMTDTDYEKHITGLINARLAKPKKMKVRHSRYWCEILTEYYMFDRDDVETKFVKTISREDLINFYRDYVGFAGKQRSKMSIHIQSKDHREPYAPTEEANGVIKPPAQTTVVVDNHIDFKRFMRLFPLPRPAIDLPKPALSKL